MPSPEPSAHLGMSVGRLESFSDGVFAIVITLLILDVKVPASAHGHLGSALAHWPAPTTASRCSTCCSCCR